MNFRQKVEKLNKDLTIIITNDSKKVSVDESSPLYEIVRDLHESKLPHNFIFDTVDTLLQSILEYKDVEVLEDLEDVSHEILDGIVDIYNQDLIKWSADFYEYIDSAKADGFIDADSDFMAMLSSGQYYHINSIYSTLINDIDSLDI